jgi:hypothetical protein
MEFEPHVFVPYPSHFSVGSGVTKVPVDNMARRGPLCRGPQKNRICCGFFARDCLPLTEDSILALC